MAQLMPKTKATPDSVQLLMRGTGANEDANGLVNAILKANELVKTGAASSWQVDPTTGDWLVEINFKGDVPTGAPQP